MIVLLKDGLEKACFLVTLRKTSMFIVQVSVETEPSSRLFYL